MFIIAKHYLIKYLQLIILALKDLFWLHPQCTLLLDPQK